MKYKGEYMLNKRNRHLYVVREDKKVDRPADAKAPISKKIKMIFRKMKTWLVTNWKNRRSRVVALGMAVIGLIALVLVVNLKT